MRIIAGKHRSRVLGTLSHEGTRPTADRVREAIFSKVQLEIKGAKVLDLFAGTGALGFEALSRGAKEVFFVDNYIKSTQLIEYSSKLLKEEVNIFCLDYNIALGNFAKQKLNFDIIFIDPPYSTPFAKYAIDIIAKNNLLAKEGVLIWEHEKLNSPPIFPEGLFLYDQKKYGKTFVSFITTK